jgi:hypothetical protein
VRACQIFLLSLSLARRVCWAWAHGITGKDENGTEISWTEPHRFLHLIRSNSYFLLWLYRFRFRILDVSYFKCKSRNRFRYFSTVFYFSTFNLKYSEFKIRFKPNLANCTGHIARWQAAQHTNLYLCVGYYVKYLRPRIMHLLIIICTWIWSCMYLVMHLVLRVGIPYWVSYIDRVRYKSARIGSFSEFSIFRKFVFVFVSGFTVFAFVFVFSIIIRRHGPPLEQL